METAKISDITRINSSYRYKITLDSSINGKTKYYFKFNPNEKYELMFSRLANLLKLWSPKYRNDVKASLATCFNYYNLIDASSNSISFKSLVGKEVFLSKKGRGLSYDSKTKSFLNSCDKDFLCLLFKTEDYVYLDRQLSKIKNDESIVKETIKLVRSFGKNSKEEIEKERDTKTLKLMDDLQNYLDANTLSNDLKFLSSKSLLILFKKFFNAIVEALHNEIDSVREEFNTKVDSVRESLHNEIGSTHKELYTKVDSVLNDVTKLQEDNKNINSALKTKDRTIKQLLKKYRELSKGYEELKDYCNMLMSSQTK